MAKRGATTELTQDNWDVKDEDEEAGTFTPVEESELKNRIIRKAKRSLNSNSSSGGSQGASPFAKFSGFASITSSSPFGAPKKTDSPDFSSSFTAAIKKDAEKPNGNSVSQEKSSGDTKPNTSMNPKPQENQARNLEYYRQLQSLNESVLKWMQLHLAKNSCCDFTPVFNDYKKHMDTLNVTYPVRKKEATSTSEDKEDVFMRPPASEDRASFLRDSNSLSDSHDSTGSQKEKGEETDYGAHFSSNTTNTSTFSFGIKRAQTTTSTMSPVGCTSSSKEEEKKESEESKSPTPFSFGYFGKASQPTSDKPFSFACAPKEKAEHGENDEYVPPKNEFVAVAEEDALYSKRCKLFFKMGENYSERGVGTLFLKSLEGKTQLLVRADTSLGNILLNIMLSASLPMSRTGKNNVLLVCIPNPPLDAKNPDSKEAIPILIRVKTAEDADELLETLHKHKS